MKMCSLGVFFFPFKSTNYPVIMAPLNHYHTRTTQGSIFELSLSICDAEKLSRTRLCLCLYSLRLIQMRAQTLNKHLRQITAEEAAVQTFSQSRPGLIFEVGLMVCRFQHSSLDKTILANFQSCLNAIIGSRKNERPLSFGYNLLKKIHQTF